MSSNYPPGVTGNEYAIGGAEREWEETRECPHCGWEGPMPHEAHREFGIMAWCANPDLVDRNHENKTVRCPLTSEGFVVDLGYDGPDAGDGPYEGADAL